MWAWIRSRTKIIKKKTKSREKQRERLKIVLICLFSNSSIIPVCGYEGGCMLASGPQIEENRRTGESYEEEKRVERKNRALFWKLVGNFWVGDVFAWKLVFWIWSGFPFLVCDFGMKRNSQADGGFYFYCYLFAEREGEREGSLYSLVSSLSFGYKVCMGMLPFEPMTLHGLCHHSPFLMFPFMWCSYSSFSCKVIQVHMVWFIVGRWDSKVPFNVDLPISLKHGTETVVTVQSCSLGL